MKSNSWSMVESEVPSDQHTVNVLSATMRAKMVEMSDLGERLRELDEQRQEIGSQIERLRDVVEQVQKTIHALGGNVAPISTEATLDTAAASDAVTVAAPEPVDIAPRFKPGTRSPNVAARREQFREMKLADAARIVLSDGKAWHAKSLVEAIFESADTKTIQGAKMSLVGTLAEEVKQGRLSRVAPNTFQLTTTDRERTAINDHAPVSALPWNQTTEERLES